MHGPEGQIQAIYAKHAGLSLTALAVAMLITRMFDAVTYPLIGYLSDRSYVRSGTRRNWTIAGTHINPVDRPKPQCLGRSEEHTSELQSLMRISYAVFCLKKKTPQTTRSQTNQLPHTQQS